MQYITIKQIRQLREEALAHGDLRQADICDIALSPNETLNEDGGKIIGPDGEIWTRTQAREECDRVLSAARAARFSVGDRDLEPGEE
jgi:hypothetical protein